MQMHTYIPMGPGSSKILWIWKENKYVKFGSLMVYGIIRGEILMMPENNAKAILEKAS